MLLTTGITSFDHDAKVYLVGKLAVMMAPNSAEYWVGWMADSMALWLAASLVVMTEFVLEYKWDKMKAELLAALMVELLDKP